MSFNWEVYNLLYPDLAAAGLNTPTKLHEHWLKWGKTEGRMCCIAQACPEFNHEFYRNNYPDLAHMNDKQLELHWLQWGKNEGRLCNIAQAYPEFNHAIYRNNYSDLAHMNDKQLELHWVQWGKNEGRILTIINLFDFLKTMENSCNNFKIIDVPFNTMFTLMDNITVETGFVDNYVNYIKNVTNNNITEVDNFKGHKYSFNFVYNGFKNKYITIKSPFSNKKISSDLYFISSIKTKFGYDTLICNYFFEQEKLIAGVVSGTGSSPQEAGYIYYIIDLKSKTIYKYFEIYIDTDTNVFIIDHEYISRLYSYTIKLIQNKNNLKSETISIYGFQSNLGHYLFNDITGLYIMSKYDILNNINKVIVGPYDVYLLEKYFSKINNLNIIKKDDVLDMEGHIGRGVMLKYNFKMITDGCVEFLKNHLTIQCPLAQHNLDEIQNIKHSNSPIFNIVLRCGVWSMIDQPKILTDLINKVLKVCPNAYFLIDGFVTNPNSNSNTPVSYNNETYASTFKEYENTANYIVSNVNTKDIKSLIGMNINEVINYTELSNFCLYQTGSACVISAWICNKPGIEIGRPFVKIYEQMDKQIRHNMKKVIYIDNPKLINNNKETKQFSIKLDTLVNLFVNGYKSL